ncbi:MAG: hypothetical protein IJ771_07480, partial [Clostridia bacterium]|nr:hypothetical protein [Clostridia bacterium]
CMARFKTWKYDMLLARRKVQEAGQWNAVGAESGLAARALGPFHHPACVKGVRMRTKSLLANAEGVICLSNPLIFQFVEEASIII